MDAASRHLEDPRRPVRTFEAGPPRRRSTTFRTALGVGTALLWMGLLALGCGNASRFGQCMAGQTLHTLVFAGDVALVAIATWIGLMAARQTGLPWLGWAVGIGVFTAIEGGMLLLGLRALSAG